MVLIISKMNEKRFSETERNCYYTSLVFDCQTQEELGTNKSVKLLNEQQATIEQLQEEIEELKREMDGWKSSTCSYMNKDSILSMDCQIVQEALWELEKEIEFGSKREDLFFDLKEKFEKLNNHRIGVF